MSDEITSLDSSYSIYSFNPSVVYRIENFQKSNGNVLSIFATKFVSHFQCFRFASALSLGEVLSEEKSTLLESGANCPRKQYSLSSHVHKKRGIMAFSFRLMLAWFFFVSWQLLVSHRNNVPRILVSISSRKSIPIQHGLWACLLEHWSYTQRVEPWKSLHHVHFLPSNGHSDGNRDASLSLARLIIIKTRKLICIVMREDREFT